MGEDPVAKKPKELSIGRVLNVVAAQAGPLAFAERVRLMALSAMIGEKPASRRDPIRLSGVRIHPVAIGVRHACEPGTAGCRAERHRKNSCQGAPKRGTKCEAGLGVRVCSLCHCGYLWKRPKICCTSQDTLKR